MNRSIVYPAALGLIVAFAGCGASSSLSSPAAATSAAVPQVASAASHIRDPRSARAIPATVTATCAPSTAAASTSSSSSDATGYCSHIQLSSGTYGPTTAAAAVPGFHPADLQSAYNLPSSTAGKNQTIGIVVAGSNPNAESDLAVYRSTFGLPACTSASGCLRIARVVPAIGVQPTPDPNWAAEVAIDLDMASAICPNCKLLLMQAASTRSMDLFFAANVAVINGATVVSNSYTIPESADLLAISNWSTLHVPLVAAAGDTGYGQTTNWPASSAYAIAVGGTTLQRSSTARGWTETAWSGSGSGCSSLAVKPAWQTDLGCKNRSVSDVSAVADPATPVAVYNSYASSGWVLMAGTSVATPIVAGVYALAGNASSIANASSLYSHSSSLNPVDAGSNGSCSISYLCVAGAGYDGPTGLGSPNGVAAF